MITFVSVFCKFFFFTADLQKHPKTHKFANVVATMSKFFIRPYWCILLQKCFHNRNTVSFKSCRAHMTRFAYVCKFCIYAKFAYVRKSGHVYAFTHVCKICTYAKVGKFAPASDQVQISFCVYAKFAYMQIWPCEQKAKFAHASIYFIVLNNY